MRRVAEAFDRDDIPYVVIGGQAVIAHGHARFTGDADFSLPIPPWDGAHILGVVEAIGLRPKFENCLEDLRQSQLLPCTDSQTSYDADFSFVDSDYLRLVIDRAKVIETAGYPVRFLSVEDLLIHKIIANRAQDQIDIHQMLLRHRDCNSDEIRYWLGQFEQVLDQRLLERFEDYWRKASH